MRRFASLLGLAVSYYIAARLSLLLAIPPGFATPVWPAAGIALVGALLLGRQAWLAVLLGSALVNVEVAVGAGASLSTASLAAALIGVGAALQALAGAELVRRFVAQPQSLIEARDVVRFLVLAGPVACVVNALVGPAALLATGTIESAAYFSQAVTWWAGDLLGVVSLAPVALAVLARPSNAWRQRRYTVAVPLLGLFALSVVAYVATSRHEERRMQSEFTARAQAVADAVRQRVAISIATVESVAAAFETTPEMSPERFEMFASGALEAKRARALEWIPRVRHADREAFERELRRASGVGILERTNGRLVRASDRAEYYPVRFVEPNAENRRALGFDLASEPTRREAIERAQRSGVPVASAPIDLVQRSGSGEGAGVLILAPVTESSPGDPTGVRGFALGVLRVGALARSAASERIEHPIDLEITDEGSGQEMFSTFGKDSTRRFVEWLPIDVGGRKWMIEARAGPAYLAALPSWEAAAVLLSATAITALVGALLLIVTGRSTAVERLVTERTAELSEANEKLARGEERFRDLLDAAPDAIVNIDSTGSIVLVNAQAEATFGYERTELVGRPVEFLLPETLHRVHEAHRSRYLEEPSVRPMGVGVDLRGRRKDGTEFPVDISLSPIETAEGLVITAAIRDVSERRRSERSFELLREIAIASNSTDSVEDALLACVKHAGALTEWPVAHVYEVNQETGDLHPTDIWQIDDEERFREFRRITMSTTFAAGEGLPGRVLMEKRPVWLEDARQHENFLRRDVENDLVRAAFAFPVVVGDEVTHVVELFSVEPQPRDARLLSIVEQIGTQSGRVVERARALDQGYYAAALERSNRELQLFAHVASHDLREPLRMVTSFLGLLSERYSAQLDDRAQRYIGHAVQGADHMQRLLQSLLEYSRVESRGSTFAPTDLDRVFDKAVGNLREAILESGARIQKSVDLPTIPGDEAQLVQVFQNLFSNSIRFRRDEPPEVTVKCRRKGSLWEITVSDNGIGLDMTYANRIFEVFERLHTREEYPGTGVGLAICKKIIERHGGRIWVESQPGHGAGFHFSVSSRTREVASDGAEARTMDSLG